MPITVAGAGIIGASIAYHLAKRGAKVKVLEAAHAGSGATGKSFGWINATFSKRPRHYFELNLAGMAGWRRLESELDGAIRIQWGGSVAWPADPQSVRQHQEWGYKARLIDSAELQRLLPAFEEIVTVPNPRRVSTDNDSKRTVSIFSQQFAVVFCEQEGAVDPLHATTALLEKAQQLGAEIQYGQEVTAIDRHETLVLACGTASPRLAQTLGIHIPLKDSPGVLVYTSPQSPLIDRVVLAPGVYFKQDLEGRIVAGGPIVAGAGTAITEASVEQAPQIIEQAAQILPQLQGVPIERVTLGHRVMPLDEYPIVGFAADNLYVAATHSGVTLAPLIGELAAQEILDGVRASALEPYRLSRFAI